MGTGGGFSEVVKIKVASVFLHDTQARSLKRKAEPGITTAKCLVLKHHRRGGGGKGG